MSSPKDILPATSVVTLGRPEKTKGAAVNPPLTLTSTYVGTEGVSADERVYARFTNASWEPLEEALGVLEKSDFPALAYASGMAAVSAVLDLVPGGGVVVLPAASYNGTVSLARALAAENKFELREVDPTDMPSTIAALEGADLVWVESPSNPLLSVVDLPALIQAARDRGVMVAVDNTFSTPLRQQPLTLGADIVIHSATKFIAGHSDVILGIVVAREEEVRTRLHTRRTFRGSIPGPFEAWLALRGLRTLALRLDRAEESAGILARRIADSGFCTRVRYPGLPEDPHHALATQQMSGYGAIVSIEFEGGDQSARTFIDTLELITPATSLGGVESLAERRHRHPTEPDQVPESLVRLSIGIEDVEDLWVDISQALEATGE